MSDLVGKNLGKYQILECIGQGGMAEVYRAFQPGLDRIVALKVVHSFLSRDENFLARFRREAQAVADLRHPNIVQVYDFDVYFDRPYMVLEFIDGVTLGNIIDLRIEQKRTLEISEVLWLMQGLCSAVAYAHRQGIVHRDITPANVMLTTDGRVILTDFGLVRILGGMKFTATGQITGTPEYMSPEQAHGAPGDQRSDIYSLGVLLYESLTGRVPFQGETPVSVLLKHVSYPIPLVRDINPSVPPPFDLIVAKALSKDPDKRYQTGDELWAALESACPEEPAHPENVDAAAALRPNEKRITTMKRITPIPTSDTKASAPPPSEPRPAPPQPPPAAPLAGSPSGTHSAVPQQSGSYSAVPQASGTYATMPPPASGTYGTVPPTYVAPEAPNQHAPPRSPTPIPGPSPESSATNAPLFSIEQVGVLASQILKSIEAPGNLDSSAAHRVSRGSQSSLATIAPPVEESEPFGRRIRTSLILAAAALAISTGIVIGCSAIFQHLAGENPASFFHSLSQGTRTFEPRSFSLRKVLPSSFAFTALMLFGFSAPGLILGAFFRSIGRAVDFYLNVIGYLFVASLALLSYNAFSVFQHVPVPALQFSLAGTATVRQISSIATFNPVVTSLRTDRFTGELKQTLVKAHEDHLLSDALIQRGVGECLQHDLVMNCYLGAWTLGYLLVISISVGAKLSRGKKMNIFLSIVFAGILSFLLLVAQSSVPQKAVPREVDLGVLQIQIAEESLNPMRGFWAVLFAGTFAAGLFAAPPVRRREGPQTNVSVEVKLPT